MLRQFALGLFLAVMSAPAWAIEEPSDDSKEEDSYIVNRFSVNLHAGYMHFNFPGPGNTANVGIRLGYRLCEWAEIQVGIDLSKFQLRPEANDSSDRDHIGYARYTPMYADLRVDVTKIDPIIPWPFDWVHPEIIVGAGYGKIYVREFDSSKLEIHRRSGWILRGGAALVFGGPKSRLTASIEWIYDYVNSDIGIEEKEETSNYPSTITLNHWELGAVLTVRF